MPLFLCRWPNGDCSVVLARTKADAIVELDQVGNAEDCPITRVRRFQLQFALTDRGELALERFGDGTKEEVRAAIARAVEQERSRLDREETATTEPQTELGRVVKSRTDMPTILIDRLVRKGATKKLRNFKGRGKPS
jgi:hypothetical protein